MHVTICKIHLFYISKFHAWSRALKASALGQPRGMEWGGRWGGGSGWGTYVHLRLIHVDVWQKSPQYCKVISLQLKLIIIKKNNSKLSSVWTGKKFIKGCQVAQRISMRAWAPGTGDRVLFGTTLKFPRRDARVGVVGHRHYSFLCQPWALNATNSYYSAPLCVK